MLVIEAGNNKNHRSNAKATTSIIDNLKPKVNCELPQIVQTYRQYKKPPSSVRVLVSVGSLAAVLPSFVVVWYSSRQSSGWFGIAWRICGTGNVIRKVSKCEHA